MLNQFESNLELSLFFFYNSCFPPFPGIAASNFPSRCKIPFRCPSRKTRMQFFNSRSLPVKQECNFQSPFLGAEKPFPLTFMSWIWFSKKSDLHLENWFSPTDPHVSLLEITFQVPWTWRTRHFPGNQVGFSLGWFPNLYFLQYNWGTWLDYNKVSKILK